MTPAAAAQDARIRAGVIGGSGSIGAELLRYLCVHPSVDLAWVTAHSSAGSRVSDVLPNLAGYTELSFVRLDELPDDLDGVQAVLVALPHNRSQEVIPALAERHPGIRFIDLGGDFRTPDPQGYLKHYGREHAAPEWLERFVYGFTEFQREKLPGARLVASPGCFATSLLLGLAPLAGAGMLRGEVFATGVTGSSGSGNEPKKTTHHPERATNFRAYKALEHQHMLEVEGFLSTLTREPFHVNFVPQSGPFVRGIFSTIFVPGVARATLEDTLRAAYDGEPLITFSRASPDVRLIQGTPRALIGFAGDSRQGAAFVALDNLGKGGASQAVQSLNRMFGFDETTGLMGLPGGFV